MTLFKTVFMFLVGYIISFILGLCLLYPHGVVFAGNEMTLVSIAKEIFLAWSGYYLWGLFVMLASNNYNDWWKIFKIILCSAIMFQGTGIYWNIVKSTFPHKSIFPHLNLLSNSYDIPTLFFVNIGYCVLMYIMSLFINLKPFGNRLFGVAARAKEIVEGKV